MKNLTELNEQLEMVNKKLSKLEALGEDANQMSVEHWENVKLNLVVQIQKANQKRGNEKTKKVLYFEGAGMDFYEEASNVSDVGNFRIRTSFKNLDGEQYFIELGNCPRYDMTKTKPKVITNYALHISCLFKVTEDKNIDDENENRVKFDWKSVRYLDYSKVDITKWINENLNCDFDTIQVLDIFHGYRVHKDNGLYNLMDHIDLNHNRAAKRKEAYDLVDSEYRTLLDEKYSKISLQEMDDESITIRCYASDKALGNIARIKRIQIAG